VWGTVHDSAAASPGTDVVPSDFSVAIACCRSSGAGRDQKGSRTERGGPGPGRKTIVRGEPREEFRGQKWAPAKRLSVSWTVPPRDAFRRYPRPGYVRREGLYSYWALRKVTKNRFRGLCGPYRGRTQPKRPREPATPSFLTKPSSLEPCIGSGTDRRPAGRGDDRYPKPSGPGLDADPPGGSWVRKPYGERARTTAGELLANVVIIGGSEEAQLILRGLLRLHQHRVIGSGLQGPATLEALRQMTEPVLLIDVDSKHPVWTDFVPEALRANPATRVVLLTPSRSVRLESQARSLGVQALVRRPFAIQELLSAIGPSSDSAARAPPAPPPNAPSPGPPGGTP
jgi:CheY-like chemotaxis protein